MKILISILGFAFAGIFIIAFTPDNKSTADNNRLLNSMKFDAKLCRETKAVVQAERFQARCLWERGQKKMGSFDDAMTKCTIVIPSCNTIQNLR